MTSIVHDAQTSVSIDDDKLRANFIDSESNINRESVVDFLKLHGDEEMGALGGALSIVELAQRCFEVFIRLPVVNMNLCDILHGDVLLKIPGAEDYGLNFNVDGGTVWRIHTHVPLPLSRPSSYCGIPVVESISRRKIQIGHREGGPL